MVDASIAYRQPVTLSTSKPLGPRPKDKENVIIRFVLAKAGYDTASAVSRVARFVNIDPKYFSYASAKDKGAMTFQEVTVPATAGTKQVDTSRLCSIATRFPRIEVGDLAYCDQPLVAGGHGGSLFTVLLRRLSLADPERIGEAVDAVVRGGFINYYGHHRCA